MVNNKGFTVVELIVTFILVMSLSVGLFTVADSYRERQQKETILKELNSYRNEVLKIVQDDFLNKGIDDIEGINTQDNSSACNGFNQGVNVKYKDGDISAFCIGDQGIKYNDILYPKPLEEFVSFTNDIIYTESKEFEFDTNSDNVIDTKKRILSINVKMKHSELEEPVELRVVGVNTTK